MDAKLEASIVADENITNTDDETIENDKRTLAMLEERAETIRNKMRLAFNNGDYFQPRRNLVALNERVESIIRRSVGH